jgi:FAD/FMN-containing dehydrogenase
VTIKIIYPGATADPRNEIEEVGVGDLELALLGGGRTVISGESLDALRAGFRGQLLTAGDPGYDGARGMWNGMMDKHPGLIAACGGTADVVAAVNFARESGLLVAVRGGGHNVAGHASCDGGLVIDLSMMRSVHVDPQRQTVRAQGGAKLGDLDTETQVHGLAVPAGVVSTTGVGGLTLGGGTGWQTRKRGLTIDNLLSVEIVTADGQVRVASERENPDLFWAVRGGGGNFGVVTWFEYQAYEVGPVVWICAPFYPFEDSPAVIRAFRDFMADAPPEFGAALLFWSVPALTPWYPEDHHGKATIIPFLVYNGGLEEGERLTAPLRNLATPYVDHSRAMPWIALQAMFDPYVPVGDQQYYWKNLFLSSAGDEVLDDLVDIAATIPSKYTYLVMQPLGGPLNKVAADATAWGNRDINYMFEFDSMWRDAAEADTNIEWTRRQWDALQKHSTGGLYVNFPGFGEEGEELVRRAVGSKNYDRLAAVKAEYDPTNIFRLNQNIQPRA